jgi:hypothetical protein
MAMRDDGLVPGPAGPGQQRAARGPDGVGHGPARHAVRIGDAERETATAELGEHYAAGRLTLDELHERIALALAARTRGQLTQVMGDLPSLRRERQPLAGPAHGERLPGSARPGADASRDGRLAAIGLLLLAMLIWLFTVVIFTRHGYYYHYYPHHPYGPPWNHP